MMRRRRAFAMIPVVLTMLLAAAGVTAAQPQTAPTADAPAAAVRPAAPVVEHGHKQFAVGRREYTFVDSSRPTQADPSRGLPAQPDRTIPVRVLYPALGGPDQPITDGAPAANGRRPLIVFSHGFTANGRAYEVVVERWVRAGYIVALPTFPLTSGGGAMFQDYVNQPEDVSFVVDSLYEVTRDHSDPLFRRIHPQKLVAAGHSLGAITTYGVTYHSGVADPRIDAAIPFAGVQLPFEGGSFDARPPTPMLLVHGVQDAIVPVSGSDAMFDAATGPVSYLRMTDADHVNFFWDAAGEAELEGELTQQAVLAFLAEHLHGVDGAQDEVAKAVADTGAGEWLQR